MLDTARLSQYRLSRLNHVILEVREITEEILPGDTGCTCSDWPSCTCVGVVEGWSALLQVVGHSKKGVDLRAPADIPVSVSYNAGPLFNPAEILHAASPRFDHELRYYDPMLVEVTLHFRDGATHIIYAYAGKGIE